MDDPEAVHAFVKRALSAGEFLAAYDAARAGVEAHPEDDWLQQRPATAVAAAVSVGGNSARDAAGVANVRPPARRAKMSFHDVRELESLPGKIDALEKEQAALQTRLADPEIYSKTPQLVASLGARANEIGVELESILARWEVLEAKKADSGA